MKRQSKYSPTLTPYTHPSCFLLPQSMKLQPQYKKILKNPASSNYLVNQVQKEHFPIQAVERVTLIHSFTLFNPYGSKQNTLFDAVIATLTKELHADTIFSFDRWYKKQGFMLAEDLLTEEKQAA